MIGEVLGPGSNRSRLCHKSIRRDVVIMLVPSPSPLISPAARNRRSARVSPWSAREEGDDGWGHLSVTQRFENEFFNFQR